MPSNLSGLLNNFSIRMAALFFSFARYFRRYLLIAIMLVSEPEKKADNMTRISKTTTKIIEKLSILFIFKINQENQRLFVNLL